MKKIFNAAKAKISTVPGVNYCALFKSQFKHLGKDEIPFPCPAVFLGFEGITYVTNADNTQTGSGLLRVYLSEWDLVKADEDYFVLREEVHKALQGLKGGDDFTTLMRISEDVDPEFESLSVWVMTYEVSFRDNSAMRTYTDSAPLELKIVV